jgi:alcohol dehydrogenase class IV
MTHYAVFSNPQLREKSTIVSERIIPRAALVDPELTYSCPPRLTALTGVDVLAHSIEAYININSTPFARLVSIEAIRLVGAWLPKAVADGGNAEARQQMAWASALGGVAIAHANPTLPHALGQAAGGFVHAPHGASVAACLVAIMKISHESAPHAFADIAVALDPSAAGLPLAERAARSAGLVDELLGKIGARVTFGELGLREQDIERVTQIALTGYFTGISLHPKKVEKDEIVRIYQSCL